ncbi:Transposase [Roseibium album]|nr:Transposase [Roseibium album]
MRTSRFSDEQIISMIKEQERGILTAEVCRKHGISSASFYKYKPKFGGMDVSDACSPVSGRMLPSLLHRESKNLRRKPRKTAIFFEFKESLRGKMAERKSA